MDYQTPSLETFSEHIEKKSKFIGYIKPVTTEEEALNFLNEIRKKHYDATHNVFAYVIKDENISRFSDDGEPAKTAGAPILDVILNEKITNLIIVVTRYFGGTLLGTGGLVKAYSKAAKDAIIKSNVVTMTNCVDFIITVDYSLFGKIEFELNQFACVITDKEYTDEVNIRALLSITEYDKFSKKIIDVTGGKVEPVKVGERFIGI